MPILKIINFNNYLSKEAMAGPWHIYRNQKKWFRYEDIVNGQDEEWNNLAQDNSTLSNALVEITKFRNKCQLYYANRYGYSPEEVDQIFRIYVGYHPNYGVYMNSIGPYFGSKQAQKKGKFAFFTRRFQSANESEITQSALKILSKKLAQYSSMLDLSDLSLVLKKATEEISEGGYQKFETEVIPSLDPQSPEGRKLYEEKPVLGSNSQIVLNAKGLSKLLVNVAKDGNWTEILNKAIQQVSAAKQINPEQAQQLMSSDYSLAKSIYNAAKEIQMDLIDRNDPAAQMMEPIPPLLDWGKGKAGQQQTTALQTAPIVKSMLNFKSEILKAAIETNSQDPMTLVEHINKNRAETKKGKYSKAKGKLTIDIAKYWVDEISKELEPNEDVKSGFERLYGKNVKAIEDADLEEGFDDFDTALQVASLNHAEVAHDQIDPRTKAKMTMFSPPPIFSRKDNEPNVTAQELVNRYRILPEDEQATEDKQEMEGLVSDLGDKEMIEDTPVQIPENQPAPEMAQLPTKPVSNQDTVEESDESEELASPSSPVHQDFPIEDKEEIASNQSTPNKEEIEDEDLKSIFSNTLKTLTKLSHNYEKEGNIKEAQEIKNIIRKYK